MNILKVVGAMGLAALAVSSVGQSTPRFFELHKDPPVEVQRSLSVGQKAASDLLRLTVSLPYADPVGIQKFADAVSNPKSPLYRHFITPEEVGRRFGLPAYRVERVRQYLASQGMSIRLVGKNHLSILADATVAQAENAFHTSIQNFAVAPTDSSPAAMRFSFTTPPSVPAEMANDVLDIEGLESFTHPISHTALTATQLRTLYSVASMYGAGGKSGAGRTIAISNFDGYRLTNVPLEIKLMSLPIPSAGAGSNIKVEAVSGGAGNTGTASGEGDLDIQCVLCMAPLANITIYDNYVTTGFNPIAVYTQEVNDNTADIITESYGWSFSVAVGLSAHNLHLSMTSQGITYMAASGDHGTTYMSGGYDYDYPQTDPEVLSVGGTSVTVSSSGTRSTEVGWNSGGDSGGGGWNVTTDSFNTRPSYQSTSTFLAGAGVPSVSSVPYRLIPDVAFDADPNTGYLMYYNGAEAQYGGTSGASPTCAGLLAELEEQLITDGSLTANSAGKYRMGRVQDLLYSYNGLSSVFYDITSGTNGNLPNGVVSNAGPGWDTDSGWGPIIFSGWQAQIEKGLSSLTLSPTSVVGGLSSTGTVTLSSAAPSGGAVVTLTSSNTSAATVPASVNIAAGATSATFTVSTTAVTAATSSTITATYSGKSQTASLAVTVASKLSSVTVNPTSVAGGATSTGTVTLSAVAPTGGTVVSLKSSNASATVPTSVTVAAGATTATFTVTTAAVSAATSATITATLGSTSATASLAITAPTLSSVSLSPISVVGGTPSTGTVTLNGVAPTGGLVVALKSSITSASVPASVTVAAGAKTATFTVTTIAVTANTSSVITSTLGATSATASLTITTATSAALSSVTLSASTVVGGSTATITGTVTLTSAAGSGGAVVSLSNSAPSVATIPTSVTIAAGAKTATFPVTHVVVTANISITITATYGGTSKTATLSVTPFAITALSLSPSTLIGGATSTGTVTLNAVPKNSGVTVALTSSSTSATVAASFIVAAGSSTGTFKITTKAVTKATTATITGKVGTSSKAATLTIQG
jgi:subtilase family serine protease